MRAPEPQANSHIKNEITANIIITGTKYEAILSTSFWTGGFEPCASCTIRIILESKVSAPTVSALNCKVPLPLIVPAYSFESISFSTGTGSPLSILSSTKECPEITLPSAGIRSPDLTISISPETIASIETSSPTPSEFILTTDFGRKPISFRIADVVPSFARASRVRPINMNAIITEAASK